MSKDDKIKVLFVCLGNICRSPTAEGVLRRKVEERRWSHRFHIDSAGTGGWHAGDPPDTRAITEAKRRGVDISGLVARQVRRSDFGDFDYVLAMDRQNLRDLHALCSAEHKDCVKLFLDYAPQLSEREVPDPYYGGPAGFARVYELLEAAADGFLEHVKQHHPGL
jgi:protein-tyrosine phosphatase